MVMHNEIATRGRAIQPVADQDQAQRGEMVVASSRQSPAVRHAGDGAGRCHRSRQAWGNRVIKQVASPKGTARPYAGRVRRQRQFRVARARWAGLW